MSGSQKRISITVLLAATLVAGALFMRADKNSSAISVQQENVVVTAAPERKAIETLDKNNDGVPDWQEALLVTEAMDLSEQTTEFKEPETLTERFALDFFQDMVLAENYEAFGDTPEELVFEASSALSNEATDELLNRSNITVSDDNSAEALSRYGEMVADITTRYPDNSGNNEAIILERALRDQNPAALEGLDSKIFVYENILRDTLVLSVPSTLQVEHLNLVNSYKAILNDIRAMRTAFTDPMLTLLRMKRYQDDALGLNASLINLYTKLQKTDASWDSDSPVYLFIK